MKFHNRETIFEFNKREYPAVYGNDSWRTFYEKQIAKLRPITNRVAAATFECTCIEANWYSMVRPYYKVYPSVVSQLQKIRLDINFSDLHICEGIEEQKAPIVLIRFADGSEPKENGFVLRSILVDVNERDFLDTVTGERLRQRALSMVPDMIRENDGKIIDMIPFCLYQGLKENGEKESLENYLDRIAWSTKNYAPIDATEMMKVISKIALTVMLLSNDPSIITPDVLAKDRDRYNLETDETWKQRAVDRARRRGVVGWNIGADYEVCPHYRRPHFGLRYTGKGGTIPRIVPIKGAVVHRSKLTEVPTGYMLPDGTEVEK